MTDIAAMNISTNIPELADFSPANNPYMWTIKTDKVPSGQFRLLNLKEMLSVADENRFGVVATNVRSIWILEAILEAAWQVKSPVILEIAESETKYCDMYPERLSRIAKEGIEKMIEKYGYAVPVTLHHDHIKKDAEGCTKRSIEAGFSSLQIDFSGEAPEENKKKCLEAARALKPLGISLEIEEGEIAVASALADPEIEKNIANYYTKVEDAQALVSAIHPEAIAFFVGNGHGVYLSTPNIGFERTKEITDMAREYGAYGVLHGGTGLTVEDFNRAIHNGARKFNYATALSEIWFSHFPQELLDRMDKFGEEKGKPRRYILNFFLDEIATLDHTEAIADLTDHLKMMMEKAFLSAGKANLYSL